MNVLPYRPATHPIHRPGGLNPLNHSPGSVSYLFPGHVKRKLDNLDYPRYVLGSSKQGTTQPMDMLRRQNMEIHDALSGSICWFNDPTYYSTPAPPPNQNLFAKKHSVTKGHYSRKGQVDFLKIPYNLGRFLISTFFTVLFILLFRGHGAVFTPGRIELKVFRFGLPGLYIIHILLRPTFRTALIDLLPFSEPTRHTLFSLTSLKSAKRKTKL